MEFLGSYLQKPHKSNIWKTTSSKICAFPQKDSLHSLFSLPVTRILLSSPHLLWKPCLLWMDGWMEGCFQIWLHGWERFSKHLSNLLWFDVWITDEAMYKFKVTRIMEPNIPISLDSFSYKTQSVGGKKKKNPLSHSYHAFKIHFKYHPRTWMPKINVKCLFKYYTQRPSDWTLSSPEQFPYSCWYAPEHIKLKKRERERESKR